MTCCTDASLRYGVHPFRKHGEVIPPGCSTVNGRSE
jgi:hypothetical protein